MERSDVEKPTTEDGNQLNRNRSFKSKQLVRSQAIRESQSPPRTISPASPHPDNETNNVTVALTNNNNVITNNCAPKGNVNNNVAKNNVPVKNSVTVKSSSDRTLYDDDNCSDVCNDVISCGDKCADDNKKQQVEIQITGGTWDGASEQRQRTRRWLGHKHHSDSSRDLLSNNPRVACVCGACANCPHCRGRRRKHVCPVKQDSGISCSDDCPDCTDSEASPHEGQRKAESLDVDEQHYCRCPERKERPRSVALSRTDSEEKTEPTGVELVNFIKETLNKNARDRLTLLKIEKELHALVNDTGRCIVRFPVMTSYGRMLVHRCAALFQLSHHLDQANKTSVLVSKSGTSGGRIPCTSFKQWCTAAFPPSPLRQPPAQDLTHAKSILKRDTNSLDEPGNGSLANSRSKSLEQREKDYERMKRRIFSNDNCTQDETQWPWVSGGPVKVLAPETGRNKLLKVQSLESSGPQNSGCRGRGAVSKSHSFGGYAAVEPPTHPRLLSRQGDLASSSWRLSPSSSGYKTLSLRSTDSCTPEPAVASPEPCTVSPCAVASGTSVPQPVPRGAVVWCVTDMAAVPPGALLIHPQTGRPLANPDGSVYRFDPANPPALYDPGYPPPDSNIEQNDKKRGKLEKQHSFMDHGECECQPSEEPRNKCCCECRRNDACTQDRRNDDKNPPDQNTQKPQSPCKNRYEEPDTNKTSYESSNIQKSPENRPNFELTNQRAAYNAPTNDVPYTSYNYVATNERAPYDAQAVANQRPPSYEQANQRERANKLTNQDSQEVYNQYGHGVRNDEQVTSPQVQPFQHQEAGAAVQQPLMQAKVTPVPIPDPNIRPMSLTNVVYPTALPQGYTYINQCRMEQPLQPVYQQTSVLPQPEEQKQLAPSPHQEPTFRIDPSYPYAAVDYAAQCGACVDPNAMRSYNVSYGQVEMPQTVLPPAYPVGNVLLPQPHIQHYPYQEAVQWQGAPLMAAGGKLLVPEPYPLYHNVYAQYSLLYPQVIPQHYPVCQPIYQGAGNTGIIDKPPSRRNSVASQRHSIASRPPSIDEHQNNNNEKAISRRNSTEIAVKIQQIKEQMAALNTRDREVNASASGAQTVAPRRDEWRRRLMNNYPRAAAAQGRSTNDETQLSSAARAIVNSIRNMQAKSTYQDTRRDYHYNRSEYRPRRPDREPDSDRTDKGEARDDRRRAGQVPFQCRAPYALRQMTPGTWCRRSPGPVHPVLNHPRRPHPDTRNGRR